MRLILAASALSTAAAAGAAVGDAAAPNIPPDRPYFGRRHVAASATNGGGHGKRTKKHAELLQRALNKDDESISLDDFDLTAFLLDETDGGSGDERGAEHSQSPVVLSSLNRAHTGGTKAPKGTKTSMPSSRPTLSPSSIPTQGKGGTKVPKASK
jgi:hypothetical protein